MIAKEDEDKKTDGKQILSFLFFLYLAFVVVEMPVKFLTSLPPCRLYQNIGLFVGTVSE